MLYCEILRLSHNLLETNVRLMCLFTAQVTCALFLNCLFAMLIEIAKCVCPLLSLVSCEMRPLRSNVFALFTLRF